MLAYTPEATALPLITHVPLHLDWIEGCPDGVRVLQRKARPSSTLCEHVRTRTGEPQAMLTHTSSMTAAYDP